MDIKTLKLKKRKGIKINKNTLKSFLKTYKKDLKVKDLNDDFKKDKSFIEIFKKDIDNITIDDIINYLPCNILIGKHKVVSNAIYDIIYDGDIIGIEIFNFTMSCIVYLDNKSQIEN